MQSHVEYRVFEFVKESIASQLDADDNKDSVAVKAMHFCHHLMSFEGHSYAPAADLGLPGFFHSTTIDLLTARGACGSYSEVLGRMIASYDYPVRIGQMKARGASAAHTVLEVWTESSWIVLDPTYDLYFIRPDHRIASFEDVERNWPLYATQVPEGYNKEYQYEGVRYTNWSKIPILMPFCKMLLDISIGQARADKICLRSHFLSPYRTLYHVLLYIYISLLALQCVRLYRKRFLRSKTRKIDLPDSNPPASIIRFGAGTKVS